MMPKTAAAPPRLLSRAPCWAIPNIRRTIQGRKTPMATVQQCLFQDHLQENEDYLKSQLITYIGNKRALLPFIDTGIRQAKAKIGKEKISFLDLFSGSGVVARMARKHCHTIHCNDIELYSFVVNSCYQKNADCVDEHVLKCELDRIKNDIEGGFYPGFITDLYAPRDENNIMPGERVFYTRRNATFLDSFCRALKNTPDELKALALSPVLSQASMYTNTSGVFKGFYKNKDGIGQFGGSGQNALVRIKKDIELKMPIFSNFSCESRLYNCDANSLVREIEGVDIAYFDPPYNQHPYGSNYFMLNLLCDYRRPEEVSNVSGIPTDWKRSLYNKSRYAEAALFEAVENVKAKFVLISYNSEGFISHERFLSELIKLGEVSVMDTRYNTFRGCRNLSGRDIHVTEFLYLVDKR
jgi:adenine-specific DNA-methyltransferase